MNLRWLRKGGDRGQSMLELALVLPLLVFLGLGLIDLARAIRANNAIINMSREGANLVLRARTSFSIEQIMNSIAHTSQPLDMDQDGTMCVTEIRRDTNGVITVVNPSQSWSKNRGGCPIDTSRVAKFQTDIASGSTPILPLGQSLYVFEIGYTYHPLFSFIYDFSMGQGSNPSSPTVLSLSSPTTLYSATVF